MDESIEVTKSDSIEFYTQDPVCPAAPKLRPIDMTESFRTIPAHSRSGVMNNTEILTTLVSILIEERTSILHTTPIELNHTQRYLYDLDRPSP